jgi:hypothetical protein
MEAKYKDAAERAQKAYEDRKARWDPYGPDTLYVHICPDSVLDMHIRTHLCSLRGDGELKEDVTDEMVEKVRKIVRAHSRTMGVDCKLPKEEEILALLQKTWSENRRSSYENGEAFSTLPGVDINE